jgi:hypothetical protein
MARGEQAADIILVIDPGGQEHYVNVANIAEVVFDRDVGGQVTGATMYLTVTTSGSRETVQTRSITVHDEHAQQLRRELRQRAGLPDQMPQTTGAEGVGVDKPA